MLESKIQRQKIKELESKGYYVIKLITTNRPGVPDILAIPPGSDILMIEVKGPSGKTSPLQDFRIKELRDHGINVEVYKPL
jgi:Holliday junction resolvase